MQEIHELKKYLSENSYPGRGIVIGTSQKGEAVIAYFIMGRSENSRNRVFKQEKDGVIIYPHDASKVEDPSLIIYAPYRKIGDKYIITNGDQTDTIYNYVDKGIESPFSTALFTRTFEPDMPNYTPRISGIVEKKGDSFCYSLSILYAIDDAKSTARAFFDYTPTKGEGRIIHTYQCDGNPLPSFAGEPRKVVVSGDIDEFTNEIWQALDKDNKISLLTVFIDSKKNTEEVRIINKHQ